MWDYHAVPELIIRDMTRNEFDEWRDGVIQSFADEQVAAGTWSSDEAVDLATKANEALLPQGFATAGMLFFRAALPDGTYVGVLWLGLTHPRGTPDSRSSMTSRSMKRTGEPAMAAPSSRLPRMPCAPMA
jgi:hypothetical protein